MRYRKAAIFFVTALLVQTNLLNLISVFGYTPNLCLALVIVFAFLFRGEYHSVIFGIFSGIIYDAAFSSVVGPTALALTAVYAFIYIVGYTANNESYVNMFFFAAGSTAIYYFFLRLFLKIAGDPRSISAISGYMLGSGIYTVIVSMLIFAILLRIRSRNKKDGYKRWLI